MTTDSAKSFVQRYPDEGKPATDSTVVFVMYDATNLYVAFKCYARPGQLTLQVASRDDREGDNVGLLLSTFDDKSSAYYFCVNAKGVQYDSRITCDANSYDNSWDGVWFSDAKVTDYGYCAELRIPFKTIRYKPGLDTWGINFDRYVPRNDQQSDWALQRHGILKVSQAGRLEGIQPHSRGINLEVYPVGLVRYDQKMGTSSEGVPILRECRTGRRVVPGLGDFNSGDREPGLRPDRGRPDPDYAGAV